MNKFHGVKKIQAVFVLFSLSLGLLAALPAGANDEPEQSPVYTKIVEDGKYSDTLEAVKEIIKSKGINIAHTLPPSDMLGRTGPAFGITQPILQDGEIIEFCSAKVSHQLIQANPENIVLCPFVISVYVLSEDPANVRMTYRMPYVIDEASQTAIEAMNDLVIGIIEEAAEW